MKRGKKLQGNGMWESSRMMLPEHKQAILQHRSELKHKPKPLLDEQRLEEWSRQIAEAMHRQTVVHITVYHPFHEQVTSGRVRRVDPIHRKIQLVNGNSSTWIWLSDIVNIGFS